MNDEAIRNISKIRADIIALVHDQAKLHSFGDDAIAIILSGAYAQHIAATLPIRKIRDACALTQEFAIQLSELREKT